MSALTTIPTDHEMMVFQTMAKQAVDSKMYRGIGDEAGVMMIMLAARELGIPVMQALNGGINIIQGKIEISARMMSALIRKAGHSVTIKESTDVSCTLVGRRADTGDYATVVYSIQDAQRAGLIKPTGGWAKNPKDMCFARAMSRLARQLFSDTIGIGYIEGEISGEAKFTPLMPGDIQEVEVSQPDEDYLMSQYMELFVPEDSATALEYLSVVQSHFSWSTQQALVNMLADRKKTINAFNVWKNKREG